LISFAKHYPELQWGIAENFRFLATFDLAAEISKGWGKINTFHLQLFDLIDPKTNPYYNTEWRKIPGYQGGFILDGGVHFSANLRSIINKKITKVAAFSALNREYLPPVDTVNGILQLEDGSSGTFAVSFGTSKGIFDVTVQFENGYVTSNYDTLVYKGPNDKEEVTKKFADNNGTHPITRLVQVFVESVITGKSDPRLSPEEALEDVLLVESLLNSGEQGGAVQTL